MLHIHQKIHAGTWPMSKQLRLPSQQHRGDGRGSEAVAVASFPRRQQGSDKDRNLELALMDQPMWCYWGKDLAHEINKTLPGGRGRGRGKSGRNYSASKTALLSVPSFRMKSFATFPQDILIFITLPIPSIIIYRRQQTDRTKWSRRNRNRKNTLSARNLSPPTSPWYSLC